GLGNARRDDGSAFGVDAERVVGRAGDAYAKIFGEKCVVDVGSHFGVMNAFSKGVIDLEAEITKAAVLRECGRRIVEHVGAREVVSVVLAKVRIDFEHPTLPKDARPEGRDVVAEDLGALVLAEGLLVVLIGDLIPGARDRQIEMVGVDGTGCKVEAVKEGFDVAVVVERDEFRGIEKAPAVIDVSGNEIADAGASDGE